MATTPGSPTSTTMPSGLTTLTEIHKLEERYPFKEEELEVLVRCHDNLQQETDKNDFLLKLALASPYSHYFLPGNEMRSRVEWIENHVLPQGLANELRAAISADAFVDYANQGSSKSLERFLEGVADTGRRGAKEALKVLYDIGGGGGDGEAKASDLVDVTLRLAVASDVLEEPNYNKEEVLARLQDIDEVVRSVSLSLVSRAAAHPEEKEAGVGSGSLVLRQPFIAWAEDTYPMFSAPLSTFVHNLLFHGHSYPPSRIPFVVPRLDHASDVLLNRNKPLALTALSLASPNLGGKVSALKVMPLERHKQEGTVRRLLTCFVFLPILFLNNNQWHRLYSSETNGRSFNRLEWSLLGYGGPTMLVVKSNDNNNKIQQKKVPAVLGAYIPVPWRQSRDFYGDADFFLFQLSPNVQIFRAVGPQRNYMYIHSRHVHGPVNGHIEGTSTPHGIGFGGCYEKPRFFIPESFEHCSGDFLDRTYESGNLLPADSLERFEIGALEVWGVGGDAVISEALRQRAEYRERTDTFRRDATSVHDKSFLAKDMQSGLIEGSKLFAHQKDTRGSHKFRVDDKHGGYVVDHKVDEERPGRSVLAEATVPETGQEVDM